MTEHILPIMSVGVSGDEQGLSPEAPKDSTAPKAVIPLGDRFIKVGDEKKKLEKLGSAVEAVFPDQNGILKKHGWEAVPDQTGAYHVGAIFLEEADETGKPPRHTRQIENCFSITPDQHPHSNAELDSRLQGGVNIPLGAGQAGISGEYVNRIRYSDTVYSDYSWGEIPDSVLTACLDQLEGLKAKGLNPENLYLVEQVLWAKVEESQCGEVDAGGKFIVFEAGAGLSQGCSRTSDAPVPVGYRRRWIPEVPGLQALRKERGLSIEEIERGLVEKQKELEDALKFEKEHTKKVATTIRSHQEEARELWKRIMSYKDSPALEDAVRLFIRRYKNFSREVDGERVVIVIPELERAEKWIEAHEEKKKKDKEEKEQQTKKAEPPTHVPHIEWITSKPEKPIEKPVEKPVASQTVVTREQSGVRVWGTGVSLSLLGVAFGSEIYALTTQNKLNDPETPAEDLLRLEKTSNTAQGLALAFGATGGAGLIAVWAVEW